MARGRVSLDRLLRPRSIAVFGGDEAAEVVRQCERLGFDGAIYPLHPRKNSVAGHSCYREVAQLPKPPDAAFIGVNHKVTIGLVRDLAAFGAGGAVCYASGFKETGDAGLQRQLVETAGPMPIIGPNCYGLINYLDGIPLWPDQHGGRRVERGVAILTQSGNIAINLSMQRRALPIAYLAALGNQAMVGLSHMIEAVLDDARVSVIGLHVEGINDCEGFARAARRASERGVPIVALKTGRSEAGARLTLSHTASLAGADRLIEAFFVRLGIACVPSLTVFLDALKLLHVAGPLPGKRIGVMSSSGGEASLIVDAAARGALEFPPLTQAQRQAVAATLPALVHVSNPLDYNTFTWGDRVRLQATYTAMLRCGFDLTLAVLDMPRADRCNVAAWRPALAALAGAVRATGARTALLATLPECAPEALSEELIEQGITPLLGVDDALSAIEAAVLLGAADHDAVADLAFAGIAVNAVDARTLDEWTAKQWLAGYGLPVPAGCRVNPDAAAEAAAEIGFPVVVKRLGADLAHKTELGAVVLNLNDAAAVAAAAGRVSTPDGMCLVEAMVTDGVAELIVGVDHDPHFGLYLVVGSGGVLVELVGDSRVLLLPASNVAIEQTIRGLRAGQLLTGYRGRPAGDINAAVVAIQALAGFALEQAECLLELDINPLIVRPEGRGVVAADALIRCRADGDV